MILKYRVASRDEIPPGTMRSFEVGGLSVLVVEYQGSYYALEDRCSHAEAPLSEGAKQGKEIQCPVHGALFDLTSGEALSMPAVSPVETFPVYVEGGEIYVEVD